jgi:hypothetical protein
MIHQFVNVTGRIVATERGEMAIPECIADAEADCGTPAVLPSMPSGENVVLLRKEPARELTIEYLDGNGLGLSCDIERPRAALF